MRELSTKFLIKSALVCAIYVVLTQALSFLSYREVQFRVSEILVLLVIINPKFIYSVALGTFLANLSGPFGILDATLGSLVSVLAMIIIINMRKHMKFDKLSLFLMSLSPVILNAVYVPALLMFVDPANVGFALFLPIAFSVGLGEFVVVSIVGIPVLLAMMKNEKLLSMLTDIE